MNDLIFIDHVLLQITDSSTFSNQEYRDYFSLYRRWHLPPGVECWIPRNTPLEIKNPWNITTTRYPLPVPKNISFVDAADSFGQSIADEMDAGKHVYLLWSGGIDSTCGVVSVLKHCKPEHHSQIHVVMSDGSRQENPIFYENHLKHYDRIEYSNLNFANIDIKNILILDGEGGDQMFGSIMSNKFFSMHPDKMHLPWRSQIDLLIKLLRKDWDTAHTWDVFLNMVSRDIPGHVQVETCLEFFWWMNFNFKFDSVCMRTPLYYGSLLSSDDFKYLMTNCIRRLFAHTEVHQWCMSADSNERSEGGKLIKMPAKRYIYEFDHNEYYLREKRKELSTPVFNRKYFAMDKDYNRYSLDDRMVRQHIRQLLYPNAVGKIQFEQVDVGGPVYDLDLKFWKSNPIDK
jgi:hypothetical protein